MHKKTIFVFLLLFAHNQCNTQNFVAKKKKGPSISTLKTNCCDACGDLLSACAQTIEKLSALQLSLPEKNTELLQTIQDLGALQCLLLSKVREIVEEVGDGFFAHASKNELQTCCDKSEACHETMTAFEKNVEVGRIKAFHNKVKRYMEYVRSL